MSRIIPVILLVIVILAIIFFVFGLLQLLIRCFTKRPSFSSFSQSNGLPDAPNSHTFQRELQHLFRLQDSGLDQALIDALPVFYYKEIIGLKEPFDCAVCLCEFSYRDKLKLIPNCTHAFHIHCIETWLLCSSTCPLCRRVIEFHLDNSVEKWKLSYPNQGNDLCLRENVGGERVFSVMLGKLRGLDEYLKSSEEKKQNEVCSNSIDARRCYSMGAFQYIVCDAELQVALSNVPDGDCDIVKSNVAEENGRKINPRSRGDSFSISKIWLWSKKGRFASSSDANESVMLPLPNRTGLV